MLSEEGVAGLEQHCIIQAAVSGRLWFGRVVTCCRQASRCCMFRCRLWSSFVPWATICNSNLGDAEPNQHCRAPWRRLRREGTQYLLLLSELFVS